MVKAFCSLWTFYTPDVTAALKTLSLKEPYNKALSNALAPIDVGHKINKPEPLFHKIDTDENKLTND